MGQLRVRITVATSLAAGVLAFSPAAAHASFPTPPPSCAPSTSHFSDSTQVTIGTGIPSVSTTTISVSGVKHYLEDVDVTTHIQHTGSDDLDITVTSPVGTVVTLTSDNGGTNDDVFDGTVWDDDANPGGQVPYSTNNGLVTDHVFANATPVPNLTPEEALAAFQGEDPNGTWTLRVSDDANSNGGSLNGWELDLQTLGGTPTTGLQSFVNATDLVIPTSTFTGSRSIVVSAVPGRIQIAKALTSLTHTSNADVDMTVTSPAGTVVTLTTDNGGANDDVFNSTLWEDDIDDGTQVPYVSNQAEVTEHTYVNGTPVNPILPEEPMGAFIGEDPNGTWTLTISDDTAGNGGTLDDWSLGIFAGGCPRPDGRVRLGSGAFVGNNVYNTTGAGQTRTGSATPGHSVTYTINAQNDSVFADILRVHGLGSTTNFTVVYRDANGANITSQVTGTGGYITSPLAPTQSNVVRMVVTVKNGAPTGATLTRKVTVFSDTDNNRKDVVKTVTHRS